MGFSVDIDVQEDWDKATLLMGHGIHSRVSLWNPNIVLSDCIMRLRQPVQERFILLCGPTGTGKTFSAIGYTARNAQTINGPYGTAIRAKYLHNRDLIDLTGVGAGADKISLAKKQILILDDLRIDGEANTSKGVIGLIEDLVDLRLSQERQTLITTNCTPEEFRQTYGERVYSRINSSCLQIVSVGKDYRLTERTQAHVATA